MSNLMKRAGTVIAEKTVNPDAVFEGLKDFLDTVMSLNPTKEQVVAMGIGVFGFVSLYAIRKGYNFEGDWQSKKVSFAAPSQENR